MSGNVTADMQAARDEAGESRNRYPVYLPTLPPSWRYERFGKILDVQGGSQPPKSQFIYDPKEGYVQLLQIRDFGERSVPTFVREDAISKTCVEDDVLIARYGASLGRIVTGKAGAYNVALAKVIYDKNLFYNRYLFYLLQTPFFQTPIHMISRSAQNGFNKGDLSDILLPVARFQEQQQIVAEIEKQFTRLEAGVAGLRRVQANLKRYRAAVLKAACEGKLVPTEAELARQEGRVYETGAQLLERILTERRQKWNAKQKYKKPTITEKKNLEELPDGWIWATAEQICEFITKGTTPHADKLHSGSGEVQFLKVYNLTFTGRLDHQYKPVFVDRKTHDGELARSKVKSGDVLINIVGPPLGQVCIVPDDVSEANINQAIARFSSLDVVFNRFLSTAFQSEAVMSWAIRRAKTTAGQANLTLEVCRDLPVPLPPFGEQQRIVAEVDRRLSVVEELEASVSANHQRATRLRRSILQKAFSGSLVHRSN